MRAALPQLFFTILLFTLPCTCVLAQSPISFGQRYQMRSEILNEDRVLNVLLPSEYEDSTANRYPVVYLLDGAVNEDFFHASGLIRYFDDHEMMPPTILVGIANVDRKRDFTYPSRDPRDQRGFPTTGGSTKFIDFLERELPTYVEKTFRTTDHRTLIGQSLGGLLATEVLLKRPGHFNDYIIVSPSLWWDKEGLYNDMDSLVNALDSYPDRLFVSVGEEYPHVEFKVPEVTLAQATVMVRRFLASQGVEIAVSALETEMPGGEYHFYSASESKRLPSSYQLRYAKGVLSIIVDGAYGED